MKAGSLRLGCGWTYFVLQKNMAGPGEFSSSLKWLVPSGPTWCGNQWWLRSFLSTYPGLGVESPLQLWSSHWFPFWFPFWFPKIMKQHAAWWLMGNGNIWYIYIWQWSSMITHDSWYLMIILLGSILVPYWFHPIQEGLGFSAQFLQPWPVRIHASSLTAMTYAKSLTMTYQSFLEVPAMGGCVLFISNCNHQTVPSGELT